MRKHSGVNKNYSKMYIWFVFSDRSNPYRPWNSYGVFEMLKAWNYRQVSETEIICDEPKEDYFKPDNSYKHNKEALRNIAINWQSDFANFDYSYSELAEWQTFFAELGKEYGLLKEFRAEGIL